MKSFEFMIDTECTVWNRCYVKIDAKTKAEARAKVIEMAEYNDTPESATFEHLMDTTQPTGVICVIDEDGDEFYNNHTTSTKIFIKE